MANKRNLKKEINAIVSTLIGEYILTREFVPGVNAEKANNILVKILSAPGMWLQNFTTNEPDDGMIEVAIRAMELGYHLLLEKPMSNTEEECRAIVEAARKYGRKERLRPSASVT